MTSTDTSADLHVGGPPWDEDGLASSFGMPNGNDPEGGDRARASAQARADARAIVDQDDAESGEPGGVISLIRRILWVVWGDFRASWMVADSTPTWGAYIATELARPAPYGKQWLRWLRLGWAYTGGTLFTLLGHGTAHIGQSPIRVVLLLAAFGGIYLARHMGT